LETFCIQAHGSRLATRKQALWILTGMAFAMLSFNYLFGLKADEHSWWQLVGLRSKR